MCTDQALEIVSEFHGDRFFEKIRGKKKRSRYFLGDLQNYEAISMITISILDLTKNRLGRFLLSLWLLYWYGFSESVICVRFVNMSLFGLAQAFGRNSRYPAVYVRHATIRDTEVCLKYDDDDDDDDDYCACHPTMCSVPIAKK